MSINHFTRGGQLAMHRLRMFVQISYTTFIIAVIAAVAFIVTSTLKNISLYQWSLYKEYLYADFMISITFDNEAAVMQDIQLPNKKTRRVRSIDVLKSHYMRHNKGYVESQIERTLKNSLWAFFFSALVSIGFFTLRGRQQSLKKLDRGNQLMTVKKLRRLLIKKKVASDLRLDTLPLIKNKETSHMLVTGTTGAGKTNLFNKLIPQIRERPNRAILIDMTGDYVSRFYDPRKDLLLNPFDHRSLNWSPWADWQHDYECDQLAAAIVPKNKALTDPFWENASKTIFSAALKKLKRSNDVSLRKLFEVLVESDLRFFEQFFKGTEAAPYTDKDGEKMTVSVRATLANHLQGLKYLKDVKPEEAFSIRQWVKQEARADQWLFITAKPEQRESLRPFITAWLDIALNSLMSLNPDPNRRLWFIVDELPVLYKIHSLQGGLAETRKYGGCILAGIQSIAQLHNIYTHSESQSILDLFNTYAFFRNIDPATTRWISEVLGKAEETKVIENISYGANSIRDGVNMNQNTQTKPLVLETEIATLKDLEAYIRLPEGYPITKMEMGYEKTLWM